jgi:hypothetical protein
MRGEVGGGVVFKPGIQNEFEQKKGLGDTEPLILCRMRGFEPPVSASERRQIYFYGF